jgi:hypothetical protein
MRHPDFEYILGEFKRYYKDQKKAMDEYTAWLKALKLNDEKSYGMSRESFQWAKDMISKLKEDQNNVYYKVLVGFPTKSMNRNVYSERDLIAAAHTLIGKHPSINHKDDYWLSPDNPHNSWGIATVVGAQMEEGAIEAILEVPKTAKCPVCNGAPLTDLIDQKRIYNVSLEGECVDGTGGVCNGFQFSDHGFSLLTTDVLPGIPMTKIYPIESFLGFLPPLEARSKGKHPSIKIVGLTEGELSGAANPDQTIKVTQPDGKGQCPQGMFWSMRVGGCIPIQDNTATDGFGQFEKGANTAASNLRRPRGEVPSRTQMKPEGTKVPLDAGNTVARWHSGNKLDALSDNKPDRAMGYPDSCQQSDVGIETQEMPGGDALPNRSPTDQPAYGADATRARKEDRHECVMGGPMANLAGQTRVLIDQGNNDKLHPDNDDQWMIEKGGVGTGDADKTRGDQTSAPLRGGSTKDPIPPRTPKDQPATTRGPDGCPNGMHWSVPNGMCIFSDPESERLRREGPNILNEPDKANDQVGHPPKPPIDQPTSAGVVYKECPEGYHYDEDTGMCEYDAPQTEHASPDARTITDRISSSKTSNPITPTSLVRRNQPADASKDGQCRDGMIFDRRTGMCVPNSPANEDSSGGAKGGATDIQCPSGMVKDPRTGICIPEPEEANLRTDITGTKAKDLANITNSTMVECPDGYVWNGKLGMCEPTDNAPTDSHPPKDQPTGGECVIGGPMAGLAGQTRVLIDQGNNDGLHPDNDSQWLIERIREAQIVASTTKEYTWNQCITDQMKQYGDMDTAKKVCGKIKYQNQSFTVNHELQLSQALTKCAALEATLAQERVRHEAELKGVKALDALHFASFQEEKDKRLTLEGRLRQMTETVDAHDDKVRQANNERIELETKLHRREQDLKDALDNAKHFKDLYENLQSEHAQMEEKYRGALATNLALNKQITKGNEDYLRLAKDKETVEDALAKAKRLGKHIVKIGM